MYNLFTFILKEFERPWNKQLSTRIQLINNPTPDYYNAVAAAATTTVDEYNLQLQQRRLLSFLEGDDDSFLTPWTRYNRPQSISDYTSNNSPRYMSFEPGSFFAHQPTAAAIEAPHQPDDDVLVAVAAGHPKFEEPAEDQGEVDGDQGDSELEIIVYKAKLRVRD